MKRFWSRILMVNAILCGVLTDWGCSSAPRNNEHLLHSILLYNLHFRRPMGLGAEDNAIRGEYEYESHPRPNSKFDCQSMKEFFSSLNLAAVRSCLKEAYVATATDLELIYRLHRDPVPYLELEDPKKRLIPCFGKFLGVLPVPREIIFQSAEEEQLNCYSARMAIDQEQFLGLSSIFHRTVVKIPLPIANAPVNDHETLLLLATWSLSPYFRNENQEGVTTKIVPSGLCAGCMGEKSLMLDVDSLPPHWP